MSDCRKVLVILGMIDLLAEESVRQGRCVIIGLAPYYTVRTAYFHHRDRQSGYSCRLREHGYKLRSATMQL